MKESARSTSRNDVVARCAIGDRHFDHATLSGLDLSGLDLSGLILTRADLSGADLREAGLSGADLSAADLRGAILRSAKLVGANLTGADLREANLRESDLRGALLIGSALAGADFWSTQRGEDTVLHDLDCDAFCEAAESIVVDGTCSIDFKSILRSFRARGIKKFLQRIGMPEVLIVYTISCAESLDPRMLVKMLQSTFISYGGPDEPFAQKLQAALEKNGVKTFLFCRDAVPGQRLHRVMRQGIREHDRVILICSKNSLGRDGVLNEIEMTLMHEAKDGGAEYLLPIRLDKYVFDGWKPANLEAAEAVRERVIADFEGADTDQAKFDAQLLRLIGALRRA